MRFAYVEKYPGRHDQPGYIIHCRLCVNRDEPPWSWSTRAVVRKIYPRREARQHDTWPEVVTMWAIHMRVHHPNQPQPDCWVPTDVDPRIEPAERRFFEVSPEEKLLRAIFGETPARGKGRRI